MCTYCFPCSFLHWWELWSQCPLKTGSEMRRRSSDEGKVISCGARKITNQAGPKFRWAQSCNSKAVFGEQLVAIFSLHWYIRKLNLDMHIQCFFVQNTHSCLKSTTTNLGHLVHCLEIKPLRRRWRFRDLLDCLQNLLLLLYNLLRWLQVFCNTILHSEQT